MKINVLLRNWLSRFRVRLTGNFINRFFLITAFVLLIIIVFLFLYKSKKDVSLRTGQALQSSLTDVHLAIRETWVEKQKLLAQELASDPSVRADAEQLTEGVLGRDALLELRDGTKTYKLISERISDRGILDITIISPQLINVMSSAKFRIGKPSMITYSYRKRLLDVFEGQTIMIPPVRPDTLLIDPKTRTYNVPSIFFCSPIRNTEGKIIAAISLRFNPHHDLYLLARTSNAGITGEIYLIDSLGRMITESRYDQQLKDMDLLRPGEESAFHIEVRDPLANVSGSGMTENKFPLTYSAVQVSQKKTGFSSEAYRDYRGEPVFGAWLWDDEMGIGFISEIEESEALASYRDTRGIAIGLVIVISLGSLMMLYIWGTVRTEINNVHQQRLDMATESAGIHVWEVQFLPNKPSEVVLKIGPDIFGLDNILENPSGIHQRTHPDDRNASMEVYLKHASKRTESYYTEFRYRHPHDEQYRWLSTFGKIIKRHADGSPASLLMVTQDIDKRKKMEQAVENDRRRLQNLFDSSPIPFNIVKNGRIEAMNPRFHTTFGWKVGDESEPMFIDLADRTKVREMAIAGKLNNIELQFRNTAGELIDTLVTGYLEDFGEGPVFVNWLVDIGTQKRVERELSLFNSLVHSGLEFANVGAWWVPLSERGCFHALDKTAELFGIQPTEDKVYPLSAWDMSASNLPQYKEMYDEVREKIDGVVKGKYTDVDVTYPLLTASGTLRWLNVRASISQWNDQGAPALLVGVVIDVSKEKQDAVELSLLNGLVYGGLESANIGAWWIDVSEGNVFHALDKTVELIGLPVNAEKIYSTDKWTEVISNSSARFSKTRNIAEEVAKKFEGVFVGTYSDVDVNYPVYTPEGKLRWLNVRMHVPERDERGVARLLVGVVIDITQQKEAEEAVIQEQERFKFSLEAMGAHYWTLDFRTGEIMYPSSSFYTQHGYAEHEIPADAKEFIARLMHPDDVKRAQETSDEYRRGERLDHRSEFRLRKKNGEWVWKYNMAKAMDLNEHGETVTLAGITLDITERKQTEFELIEAKEDADQANKSKSEFLARMSHEIRTPMNAIIGITFLTMQTELTQKQHDNLKKVHDSALSLLGIINDILDFSKIEAGKLTLELAELDLEKVFSDLANVVTYKAHEKGLEVIFDLQPTLPAILIGDSLRLKQVLINLVNNAIKFTSHGEVVVRAREDKLEGDRLTILFSVKDTGIGLSPEDIQHLFQSFAQADNSITRKYGGTGLGLSISKSLVELLGGEVWVESVKGEGSTFFFRATFSLSKDQKPNNLQSPPELRGMHVLVCDDNETAAGVVKEMLEGFSFKVQVVNSGYAAIQMLEEQHNVYKLVFMDWNMPEMNGVDTIKAIRASTKIDPSLPCIMLTSYNRQDVLLAAEEVGVNASLIKPINYSTLFDTIMSVFYGDEIRLPKQQSFALAPGLREDMNGKLILLVEDNPINQDVAVGMLEEVGVEVEIAGNGKEGVDMIMASGTPSRYHAVLMDLRMPVMDGYEATRQIRRANQYEQLPIIAMTADAINGIKEACLEAGMNDFINKPIEVEQFYNTIGKWLRKSTAVHARVLMAPVSAEIQIPEIPGVNPNARLARFGSTTAYLKFLSNFEKHFHDFAVLLREELLHGEVERAERMVHDLKGLSGMLDAPDLHAFAVQFDDRLRRKETIQAETEIDTLITLLNPILSAIRPAVAEYRRQSVPGKKSKTKLNTAEAMIQMDQLKNLLLSSDFESQKMVKELSEVSGMEQFEPRIADLSTLISEYDFDKALVALEDLTIMLKQ